MQKTSLEALSGILEDLRAFFPLAKIDDDAWIKAVNAWHSELSVYQPEILGAAVREVSKAETFFPSLSVLICAANDARSIVWRTKASELTVYAKTLGMWDAAGSDGGIHPLKKWGGAAVTDAITKVGQACEDGDWTWSDVYDHLKGVDRG